MLVLLKIKGGLNEQIKYFVHNVYSNLMKYGTQYIITHYTSQ